MAYALKIQRKIFAAASAAALRAKIATQRVRSKKILEPSFTAATASFRIP